MSFTFRVDGRESEALSPAGLKAAVGLELGSVEAIEPDAPLSGLVHLFRPGVSTRAIEIEASAAAFSVRLMTCASAEDHELALAIVRAASHTREASTVTPEDDQALAIDELGRQYGAGWAANQISAGVAAVARVVDENPGKLITLDGPVRPFLIGDRLLAELRRELPLDGLPDRMIVAMRRTQWPGDCYAASVIGIRGGSPERKTNLAVLSGGSRTLLPDVDAVALRGPGDDQLYVLPAVLAELLGVGAQYLDERHLLVEPIEDVAWQRLLERAAAVGVDLDEL